LKLGSITCAGALPVADGKWRNSGWIHPQGGMRRKRLVDSDGSSWTRQDPQSVPRQRQRLRSLQGSGAGADTQVTMLASREP